jgi:uncharacterized membrane protein YecN with MAPEG domain
MTTAIACSAILGLLLVGLGLAVSLTRNATGTSYGCKDDPADRLYKLVRAHGNAAEWHAMLAVLMVIVGMRQPTAWMEWSMIGATLSRILITLGIAGGATLATPHPLRFIGALGTYIFGLLLVIAALLVARA